MWRLEAHPVGLGLLAAVAGLTLLFVALGPAATATLPVPLAAAYWLLHIGAGLALCVASTRLLQRFPPLAGGSGWLLLAAAAVLASMLFAPFAILLDRAFPTPGRSRTRSPRQGLRGRGSANRWATIRPEGLIGRSMPEQPPCTRTHRMPRVGAQRWPGG